MKELLVKIPQEYFHWDKRHEEVLSLIIRWHNTKAFHPKASRMNGFKTIGTQSVGADV